MTDVKVEQCDRVAAHAVVLRNLIAASGSELPWMREALADILEGNEDEHYMVQAFARHRQAAEKATRGNIADELTAYCRKMNSAGKEAYFYDAVRAIRSQDHE